MTYTIKEVWLNQQNEPRITHHPDNYAGEAFEAFGRMIEYYSRLAGHPPLAFTTKQSNDYLYFSLSATIGENTITIYNEDVPYMQLGIERNRT